MGRNAAAVRGKQHGLEGNMADAKAFLALADFFQTFPPGITSYLVVGNITVALKTSHVANRSAWARRALHCVSTRID